MTNSDIQARRAQLWAELEQLKDPRTVVSLIDNPILDTDSYKVAHQPLYGRIGVSATHSYVAPRIKDASVLFVGLQMYLKTMKPITHAMVDQARDFFEAHIANSDQIFPEAAWRRVVDEFNGYPPLTIKCVQEGSVVPSQNVLVTVTCDVEGLSWLGPYYETALLRAVWYPTTVASKSFAIRQLLRQYVRETSDGNVEQTVAFMHHDFGARGASSKETVGVGGAAHLLAGSYGTDSITGALYANLYYNTPMSAYSVFATEHSIMTMRGREGELQTVRDCIAAFNRAPGTIVSLVSDGYDIEALTDHYCTTLKPEILESGIRLVIRPDSGDAIKNIMMILRKVDAAYGSVTNSKGYKVLNVVRVLQGDGLATVEDFAAIARAVVAAGFSIENLVFGQGGGLLQMVNRDDLKFAMKTSAAKINGKWVDVVKDPITDPGKKSLAGRVELFKHKATKEYRTFRIDEVDLNQWESAMVVAYCNGEVFLNDTIDQIRARSIPTA